MKDENQMTKCDWLDQVDSNGCGDPLYSLDDMKSKFDVQELVDERSWIVFNRIPGDHILSFAVVSFNSSEIDGKNTLVDVIFHGCGPAEGLRECRHTYWGNNGYVFYPHGPTIIKAFQVLSEFFDEMV